MASNVDSRPRVLVADDERVIADTLALILKASGWNARAVYSGEAAVEAARESSPNVFLSDVVMGELSGIDAAILIQKMYPECSVLLFSGQAGTANLLHEAGISASAFEILSKPVHPKVLIDRLDQMLHSKSPGKK